MENEKIIIPKNIVPDDVYDFLDSGDLDNVPDEMKAYVGALQMVLNMKHRVKKFATREHIIKHLVTFNNVSRHLAAKLHDDAVELFYINTSISKQAHRNYYAEQQDEDIALARVAAKSIDDLEKVSKMREKAFKFRQLEQPDAEDFPDALFDRPFKIYTLKPEEAGIAKADRRGVAAFIDKLGELTELQKEVLKREAGVLPFKAFLEPTEDPRNET